VELAFSRSPRPCSLIVAAIAHVFTITYVAEMLGEDEDWLHELSIDMFPEDGCLHVYTGRDEAITAFTDYGIECLKQIISDMRSFDQAPSHDPSTQ
jgi:hypothetical protein